jgi:hypothetical protein
MSSESKILTVSYGTFSCTLEGFENPFDTMKAIAEYFRDLAAQDRHFGAEPPPPDAAMLHRLAEREVSRLAAASQREDAPKAADDTLADATVAEAGITPRIQFNPVGRRPARNLYQPETPVEEDVAAPEPSLQDVIPEGVAAKLARIRRAVNPVAADLTAPDQTAPDLTAPDLTAPDSAFVAEPLDDQRGEAVAETSDLDAAPALSDLDAGDLPETDLVAADPVADSVVDYAEAAFEETTPDVAARLGALIASDDSPAIDDIAVADAAEAWTDESGTADLAEAAELVDGSADDAVEADMLAEADVAAEDLADLAALDGVTFDDAALAAALDDTLPEDAPAEMTLADAEATDPLPEAVDTSDALDAYEVAGSLDAAPDADVAEVEADTVIAVMDAETDLADADAKPASRTSRRSRGISSRVVRLHPGEDTSPYDPSATRVLSSQQDSDDVARLMQQAEEVMAEETNRRRQEALSRLKAAVQSTEADRADLDYEAPRADVSLDPYRDDLADAIQPEEPVAPPAPPEVKPRRTAHRPRHPGCSTRRSRALDGARHSGHCAGQFRRSADGRPAHRQAFRRHRVRCCPRDLCRPGPQHRAGKTLLWPRGRGGR